ncbi:MAG TPA: nuclear transport factor 2 family protein [Rhizomicrobium sp.]|jgi:ketosteroid isomerase-like protein
MLTPGEVKRELVRRMNAKDLAGTMELIADDAVYFWSNGSAMRGKAAIAAAMQANFDSIRNDTYETLDVTWLVQTDEVAVCVFRFRWTGEINGMQTSGKGRGASVLKRVDGAWRTVHENLSQGAGVRTTAEP